MPKSIPKGKRTGWHDEEQYISNLYRYSIDRPNTPFHSLVEYLRQEIDAQSYRTRKYGKLHILSLERPDNQPLSHLGPGNDCWGNRSICPVQLRKVNEFVCVEFLAKFVKVSWRSDQDHEKRRAWGVKGSAGELSESGIPKPATLVGDRRTCIYNDEQIP